MSVQLPPTGGRNRKKEGLGPSAAMNLHSALARYVKLLGVGTDGVTVDPKDDTGYLTYYQQYTANRGLLRTHDVQSQFTRDDHLKIARAAYATGDVVKMLLISMSIASVSRGDEIRDMKPCSMRLKKIDAIGGYADFLAELTAFINRHLCVHQNMHDTT